LFIGDFDPLDQDLTAVCIESRALKCLPEQPHLVQKRLNRGIGLRSFWFVLRRSVRDEAKDDEQNAKAESESLVKAHRSLLSQWFKQWGFQTAMNTFRSKSMFTNE
jgi:hypothetical protein